METIEAGAERRAFAKSLEGDSPVYVVDPQRAFVGGLLDALAAGGDADVRLLVSPRTLETVAPEFDVESRLADEVATGDLAVRELPVGPGERLVVGAAESRLLVSLDGVRGTLTTADRAFVDALRRKYAERWEAAEEVSFRAPPRSECVATARDQVGAGFADALAAALAGADALRWGETPGPVDLVVTVGAREGVLLHDAGEWCEQVGLASRSSFSRAKTALERVGLVTTEREVQGVGRPRQRLAVADDALEAADAADLVGVLRERLG